MAENKSQDQFDNRCEGHFDAREANAQCVADKDEHLGFVAAGGVIFQEFKCEQGSWTWQGICG